MSYEKVKSISIKEKDNKVIITSACNNLRPITFERWELGKIGDSIDTKLCKLLKCIVWADLQLYKSCSVKKGFKALIEKVNNEYSEKELSYNGGATYEENKKIQKENDVILENIILENVKQYLERV